MIPPRNDSVRAAVVAAMYPDAVPFRDGWTLTCPGVHMHTVAAGAFRPGDCVIRNDDIYGLPLLTCSHHHCQDVVLEARKKLNRAINAAEAHAAGIVRGVHKKRESAAAVFPRGLSLQTQLRQARDLEKAEKMQTALAALVDRAREIAPLERNVDPGMPLHEMALRHLSLFPPGAIVWAGQRTEYGYHGGGASVDHLAGVIREGVDPPEFITGGLFGAIGCARLKDAVVDAPFFVLEADADIHGFTPHEWIARVGAALQEAGVPVKLILHSGGKSSHLWVDRAPYVDRYASGVSDQVRNAQHKNILGVDPATLKPCQPVRLAGGHGKARKAPATLTYIS